MASVPFRFCLLRTRIYANGASEPFHSVHAVLFFALGLQPTPNFGLIPYAHSFTLVCYSHQTCVGCGRTPAALKTYPRRVRFFGRRGSPNANRRGIDAYATVLEQFSSHRIFSSKPIFLEQIRYEHFEANFSRAMPKRACKSRFFSSNRKCEQFGFDFSRAMPQFGPQFSATPEIRPNFSATPEIRPQN